jgi:hypothetical protein
VDNDGGRVDVADMGNLLLRGLSYQPIGKNAESGLSIELIGCERGQL